MISMKIFGEAFEAYAAARGVRGSSRLVKYKPVGNRLLALCACVMLMALTLLPGKLNAAVATTKHNLSYVAPTANAIKAYPQGTQIPVSEICVFCHTPHHSTSANPLWNKNMSAAFYNIYASQTMVTTLGQPTGASKLCLSCHDGTIALGEMLNLPGRINQSAIVGGTIDVAGTGVTAGKLTNVSSSYIGTELGDDHPISFLYSNTYPSNVEFNAPASFTPTSVKLDAGGELQCTACHDPHGTANVYMLTADYQNGTLCLACHNKLQWATNPSVHQSTTSTWSGAGTNPWREDAGAAGYTDDTPALQGCLSCHQMHGSSVNKTLKRGTVPGAETGTSYEEWNCLNCHSGNMANANDINTPLGYTYKHDVKGAVDKHVPNRSAAGVPARETATNLQTNRHAECVDCHNPHGAMAGDASGTVKGNHTKNTLTGNYEFGPNLLGGWGVKPTGGWVAPVLGSYSTVGGWTEVDFALPLTGVDNLEGYMCMKCHTNYSYPATPPTVPSAAWAKEWDVAEAMNPLNLSHHAVLA
ncbi:MAG: hypothetical protein OEV28_14100, partial [Nitrospirota bacterium]|nr:hypothetical protein [Nitrospirota bacterium]